jgi:hypothetical protein
LEIQSSVDVEHIINSINEYENWKIGLYRALLLPSIEKEHFSEILDKAKIFTFKTSFLEKVKRIISNFTPSQMQHYKNILFECKTKNQNMNNKLIKKKIEEEFEYMMDMNNNLNCNNYSEQS